MTFGYRDEEMTASPFIGWRKSTKRLLCFLARAFMFCGGFHIIKTNGKRATKAEVLFN